MARLSMSAHGCGRDRPRSRGGCLGFEPSGHPPRSWGCVMARRLFLTKLSSIGAVTDGDNPEAEIMFWKNRPQVSFAKIDRGIADLERSRTRMETAITRLEKGAGTVTKRRLSDEEIRKRIDGAAVDILRAGGADTIAKARAKAWERNPDLRAQSRMPKQSLIEVSKESTIDEQVRAVVQRRAQELAADVHTVHLSGAELRSRVRLTDEGQMLTKLEREVMNARREGYEFRRHEHEQALKVLAEWQQNPRMGL